MATALVTCDNLMKIYKTPEADIEVVALQGLDLTVRQGELLVIVGQSGSGKTTLMNMLGALDTPNAGRCVVAGYDLTRLTERRRNDYRRFVVGHMWQQSGRNLTPDLTIAENVGLPQTLAGEAPGRRARRAHDLLEQVGLAHMTRKFPSQLSGGEQQRAAIAVALANEPTLLLADEPTGELDSATAQSVLDLLRQLNQTLGLTIILVTHDPSVAARADRTIAIRDGRVSTETVRREQPLTAPTGAASATSSPIVGAADGSAIIGLPSATHRESIIVDRAGRFQLPDAALQRIAFDGRADLRIRLTHVELWPASATSDSTPPASSGASAIIGLPADTYHESIIIDRVGRVQLSEETIDRVPFGRHVAIRLFDDHVELWPQGITN